MQWHCYACVLWIMHCPYKHIQLSQQYCLYRLHLHGIMESQCTVCTWTLSQFVCVLGRRVSSVCLRQSVIWLTWPHTFTCFFCDCHWCLQSGANAPIKQGLSPPPPPLHPPPPLTLHLRTPLVPPLHPHVCRPVPLLTVGIVSIVITCMVSWNHSVEHMNTQSSLCVFFVSGRVWSG